LVYVTFKTTKNNGVLSGPMPTTKGLGQQRSNNEIPLRMLFFYRKCQLSGLMSISFFPFLAYFVI